VHVGARKWSLRLDSSAQLVAFVMHCFVACVVRLRFRIMHANRGDDRGVCFFAVACDSIATHARMPAWLHFDRSHLKHLKNRFCSVYILLKLCAFDAT